MKRFVVYISVLLSVVMIHSCIENDLSYPALEPELLSLAKRRVGTQRTSRFSAWDALVCEGKPDE